ncbi:carbamoyltransferase family protein [Pontiella sulfatireligans]|uniref:Decarbamoylnovobiocin carbamoyltransferase n=1 Tax=Pontiella sulfatireligans TaxID=2750658 RepID=A0A6C2UMR2_9BACT|nr:carbamoyltransferase C-terminal domain-containing protein [Pontiella sulfatireligans]VGO21299.1 Decarbamoylnovobiocin carbamoyltransferase [Pontiella sulfatireligans]
MGAFGVDSGVWHPYIGQMNILGINYFYHDSTACIVVDGKLVVAIEEERLSREKHTDEFPGLAIRRCLEISGLTFEDIDAVAVSIKPTLHWEKKAAYSLGIGKGIKPFLSHEVGTFRYRQDQFWGWYFGNWPNKQKRPDVHWVPHHMSHIAGSFYVSPYEDAALLSLDGSGEWATSFVGYGKGTTVECYNQSFFPNSFGSFYEAATEFCGFRPNYDEGKTMGLASLGDPSVFGDRASEILKVGRDGSIDIDLSCFNFQYWRRPYCNQEFQRIFGRPRRHGEPFEQHHLDVAAAFQRALEEAALEICRNLKSKTGATHLVVAGGVALNSVMNGRIVRESGFEDLYVMPAAGDNGTAIGAAFYVWNGLLGNDRDFVHDNPYVGTSYSKEQIDVLIKECKLSAVWHDDIAAEGARLLHEGHIIGWFQGAMEIGPRALGNRSILADPTHPGMKDKINAEVKHREAYRPFAPSVPAESAQDYFEMEVEAPFMLKVCDVKMDKRDCIPAVTHVDGSARVQTVRREMNPLYHDLMVEFGKLSGVPVVLNTSFNVMGEPIVESPMDAIRCFFSTGLDKLVIGNYVIGK